MLCSSRGTDSKPGRAFCVECGAGLAAACPNCGSATEAGEKFCGVCASRRRPRGSNGCPFVADRRTSRSRSVGRPSRRIAGGLSRGLPTVAPWRGRLRLRAVRDRFTSGARAGRTGIAAGGRGSSRHPCARSRQAVSRETRRGHGVLPTRGRRWRGACQESGWSFFRCQGTLNR